MLGSIGIVDPSSRTTIAQFISFWGFFLIGALAIAAIRSISGLAGPLSRTLRALRRDTLGPNSPLVAFFAVLLAAAILVFHFRDSGLWVILALLCGISLCIALLREASAQGPRQWILLLTLVGLVCILIPEIFFIDDPHRRALPALQHRLQTLLLRLGPLRPRPRHRPEPRMA